MSEDFLDIRCAHNFTRRVKRFAQWHCDQFGIGLFSKFFLGFLQARSGALKAGLVSRVYGGKHRRVGGVISTRCLRNRIDKLADSLAGEAGNGDESPDSEIANRQHPSR